MILHISALYVEISMTKLDQSSIFQKMPLEIWELQDEIIAVIL